MSPAGGSVPTAPPARGGSYLSKPVVSWALYDLANTIFSMNVVSYFLSVWVIDVMGGTDTLWARFYSGSMLAMLVTAPFLGAMSDRVGRRLPFLLVSTLVCVGLTAFLGIPGLIGTLVLFAFANYAFQAGLVFYDALLPVVSTPENRGRVSGFGVGLGYVGSFLGLGLGALLLLRYDYTAVFRMTAVLFLVFSIPIFLWVREPVARVRDRQERKLRGAIPAAIGQVLSTFKQARRYRGLGRFLVGRAFYTDAANTLIAFMGIYAVQEVGYPATTTAALFLTAIFAATVAGIAWGPVIDRIGPKRAMNRVLFLWLVALTTATLIPVAGLPRELIWLVACVAGAALGGTWAADRPWMLTLSPPAKVGEFYGLYSMVGRFSAVVGPLLWAFVAEDLGLGRPASMAVLALMVAVAWLILRPVDDAPREWTAEELGETG